MQSGSMITAWNTQMRELSLDSWGCRPRNSTLPFPPPAGGRTRDGSSRNYLASSPSPAPSSIPLLRRPRSVHPSPPSLLSSPPMLPIAAGACAAMAFSCVWVLSKQSCRNARKAPHHSWYSPSRSLQCVHIPWNYAKYFIVVSSTKRM